ncbi:MAG: S-layer homology domain-containing protein [Oscillospiraceae bacterium]|jgi:predicted membrane protein|nr:S-layer homology domain-containing protein [Oscillospiraceae bacterium]
MKAKSIKIISLILMVIILLNLSIPFTAAQAPFTDISHLSRPTRDAINWAHAARIIRGTEGRFFPEEALTRATFILMLHRYAGSPTPQGAGGQFSDVGNPSAIHYNAVTWGHEQRLIQGENGRFDPDGKITREAMALILHRYHVRSGGFTAADNNALNRFSDRNNVSNIAVNAMRWAVTHDLIESVGNRLMPRTTASRAVVILALHRYDNLFGETREHRPMPSPRPPTDFSDVPRNSPAFNEINWALSEGLISGSGGNFLPDSNITRSTFSMILWRLDGKPLHFSDTEFSDVSRSGAEYEAVTWAHDTGILTGAGRRFFPNNALSREGMIFALHRYNTYKGGLSRSSGTALNSFTDSNRILNNTMESMRWAMTHGLISGIGSQIRPNEAATRELTILVIHKYVSTIWGSIDKIPNNTFAFLPDIPLMHQGNRTGCVAVAEEGLRHLGHHPRPNRFTRYARMNGDWCAMFVNYVFENTGSCHLHSRSQHRTAAIRSWSCTTIMNTARSQGRWQSGNYMNPAPGDWILFNYGTQPQRVAQHVGIVTGHDGLYVYYVDGNTNGDRVLHQSILMTHRHVRGYVTMFS